MNSGSDTGPSVDRVASADIDSEEYMKRPRISGQTRPRLAGRASLWPWTVTLFVVLALIAGVSCSPLASPPVDVASPPTHSAAPPTYPIGGYFITAGPNASSNKQKLADIKRLGGDTVITFGTVLRPATEDSLPEGCLVNGRSCAQVAAGSLKVNRYFTYADGSDWGDVVLKCPRDRSVSSNGRSYTVLVLPAEGEGCVSSDGMYDVVVVGGSRSGADDPSGSLASTATDLGMKYYAGMPAPVKRADFGYLPDLTYKRTLQLITERFLQYQAAKNDVAGLAGFYHHFEMPVSASPFFDPVLSLYEMQNQAIHRILPTRSAIISPYIESRLNASYISLDDARNGMKRIAQTSSGVLLNIAIQDGMGTGKGAAYSAKDADSPVDVFAASIVGKGTWRGKYAAPNREYFRAAAAGISGTNASLWANLEGMAPSTPSNPCSQSLRGQTTLERMDRQLQQMVEPTKVISFMWDPYFTCAGTNTSLKTQLQFGFSTPIVTDTSFDADSGLLDIIGFNLSGGSATLKWLKKGKSQVEQMQPVRSNSGYGEQRGLNPRLESISIRVSDAVSGTAGSYSLNVTNQWGASANEAFAIRSLVP
ncbi:hypothetical protein ACFRJ9_11635 [Paenarthrobacter sp. NPDC056912]|uniref:hypothetical protein n=1 Tax=Paenarthrobacter sp. NPDC056912 TaxID=3345965 RepID=UPI003672DBC7